MSASQALHTYGSDLSYSTTQGGSYTSLSEVTEMDEAGVETPEFKCTHLKSPSATHEYKAKLIEPGEVSFKCNYIAATWNTFQTIVNARVAYWWKLTTPENSYANFPAIVSKAKRSLPEDGPVMIEFTLKRSGPVTFTP